VQLSLVNQNQNQNQNHNIINNILIPTLRKMTAVSFSSETPQIEYIPFTPKSLLDSLFYDDNEIAEFRHDTFMEMCGLVPSAEDSDVYELGTAKEIPPPQDDPPLNLQRRAMRGVQRTFRRDLAKRRTSSFKDLLDRQRSFRIIAPPSCHVDGKDDESADCLQTRCSGSVKKRASSLSRYSK
jgi:hypothetical protein